MEIKIDHDYEVSLDPYIVVRVTYTVTPNLIRGVDWQVLRNDSSESEFPKKKIAQLVSLTVAQHIREVIPEAEEAFAEWAAQQALDAERED